jgi:hypothetical protein
MILHEESRKVPNQQDARPARRRPASRYDLTGAREPANGRYQPPRHARHAFAAVAVPDPYDPQAPRTIATVNRRVDIQADIVKQIDAARDGQSGVNLDEEMTNMLTYQHAYEAASRLMTAVDASIDTLIHSTGLVGR